MQQPNVTEMITKMMLRMAGMPPKAANIINTLHREGDRMPTKDETYQLVNAFREADGMEDMPRDVFDTQWDAKNDA